MDDSPDPLEEIEFLARSANRIEVLATLVSEACSRRELGERVDASQPTLGRILRDLMDRHWVEHDGERYVATATGELIADGVLDLRERVTVDAQLRPIVEYLPEDAIDVSLQRFADATVTTPSSTHPNAPLERMLELLRGTDQALLVSHSFNRQKLELLHERARDGTLTARCVFTESAIDAISTDEALYAQLADIVDANPEVIRVTTESVPLALEVTDDRVHLLLRDDDGVVRGSLDTADPEVRTWAQEVHDRFWTDAEPLVNRLE